MNRLLNNIIASINPSVTKETNFNLATADYLTKGLRDKGLKCIKKNAIVDVKLNSLYLDKYSSVIIDCMDGNLYLRGDNCKDKKWGKLRRFEGQRTADALHCANQSITRIYNRIKALESGEKQVYADDTEETTDKQIEASAKYKEYYRTDERAKKVIYRLDDRKIIGFIHNGHLQARAFDYRHKWVIGRREYTTNDVRNEILDILKEINSHLVELSYNIELESEDGYYVVTIYGGMNGCGDWRDYLTAIQQIFDLVSKRLGHIWLVDLTNDCLDDVWDLQFGVQPSFWYDGHKYI